MNYKKFKELHNWKEALLLGNVWDVNSAKICEELWFKSIGTSSWAIANSLGYEDGENMSFDELLTVVKNIRRNTSIPLNIDMEGGYTRNIGDICKNIKSLAEWGVVWINIEDSVNNTLLESIDFSNIISEIKAYISKHNLEIFLNIRTDSYILGLKEPLSETLERIRLYEEAWADWIFVPCITDVNDITKIVSQTILLVNVMAMPNLPSFDVLSELWVKRISMWPFVYNKLMWELKWLLGHIVKKQNFNSLFN